MKKTGIHTNQRSNLSAGDMSLVFSKALKNNLLSPDDTSAIFYDLGFLEQRITGLQEVFPQNTVHAIAVKANPLAQMLSVIQALGVGAEVASLPELYMAQKAGFAPDTIIFDSPCKTKEEIEYALGAGVYMNADSFAELDRIAGILKTLKSTSKIGLRINPQVGTGNILSTSVSGDISKFGIPMKDNKDRIVEYYQKYDWLTGIHVHIGSQGGPAPLLVKGIRKVLDLAMKINANLEQNSGKNRIGFFDIGGGLPVSYYADKEPVTMIQYKTILEKTCSELFTDNWRLITEFGRYVFANAGWVASKVEYVKREPAYNILMTHVGADLFLRKCYNPGDWHHEISLVDKSGNLKTGTDKNKYIIAGPLCFGGDVLARDLELPVAEEDDYILVHDAGAYTLSMWSRYNSRQMPKVIGYNMGNNTFSKLKNREKTNDLLAFWS